MSQRTPQNSAKVGPGYPPASPVPGHAEPSDREGFASADPVTGTAPERSKARSRHAVREFIRAHRLLVSVLVAAALVTGFVIGVLPQITGLGSTLRRLGRGNHLWLLLGIVLEAISISGYVALFRSVFSCEGRRIGWKASYEITLAGVVATKLLAAAGAGGIALTVWALRAAGLPGRTIARRMAGFEIILYSIFMLALVTVGLILGTGISGAHPPWTVSYLPAAVGAVVIGLALSTRLMPGGLERLSSAATRPRMLTKLAARLSSVPATIRDGLTTAGGLVAELNLGLLGAVAYWAFDIATLWASFRAFGAAPPIPVVIMGYYVGQLANAIPLPGGVGGVEGGMIGCFAILGVNAGAALVAVFAYRAISFWLPTLPGAVAYVQLRRRIGRWREHDLAVEPAATPVR